MSSIIDKIRKLRALADSSNVNEAAAAAAAAERLIQEHNLHEAEFSIDDGELERVTYDLIAEMGKTIATWQSDLLLFLTHAYQCSGVYKTRRIATLRSRSCRFVAYGRKEDLDTLRYQYAFFTAEIVRLCELQTRGRGRTFKNSFRLGAVRAIGEALREARQVSRSAATSTSLVIVDRRAELAKDKRDQDMPGLRSKGARSNLLDRDGFELGKKAGAGITQNAQIETSGCRLLGSGGRT